MSLLEPQAKKVITLFGKKINVQSSDTNKEENNKEENNKEENNSPTSPPSPSNPPSLELNFTDTISPKQQSPPSSSPSSSSSSSSSSFSSSSSAANDSAETQVLRLRLHLLEQKIKQLTDNNQKLNAQLHEQMDVNAELESEKTTLLSSIARERELVQAAEKENEMLQYKLGVYEKLHPSLSHPPPPPPADWYARGGDRDRERERDRERDRERERDRDNNRDRDGYDERWNEQYNNDDDNDDDDDSRTYSPPFSPPYDTSFGLHLPSTSHSPSPPHHNHHDNNNNNNPSPGPRQNVFTRLGNSGAEMLPTMNGSPYGDEGEIIDNGDNEVVEEGIREEKPLDKKQQMDLLTRLNMPLDALTKNSKAIQKAAAATTATKTKKRPLCKFVKQYGSCKNKKCKFTHPQ